MRIRKIPELLKNLSNLKSKIKKSSKVTRKETIGFNKVKKTVDVFFRSLRKNPAAARRKASEEEEDDSEEEHLKSILQRILQL